MRPSLPTSHALVRPGPATPGGAEPFESGYVEPPPAGQLQQVFAADDNHTAPADDDGSVVGMEYVAQD